VRNALSNVTIKASEYLVKGLVGSGANHAGLMSRDEQGSELCNLFFEIFDISDGKLSQFIWFAAPPNP
jgi:hypothetical protein